MKFQAHLLHSEFRFALFIIMATLLVHEPCDGDESSPLNNASQEQQLGNIVLFEENFELSEPLLFPTSLIKGDGNIFVVSGKGNKYLDWSSNGFFDILLPESLVIPFSIEFEVQTKSLTEAAGRSMASLRFPHTNISRGAVVEFGRPDNSVFIDESVGTVNAFRGTRVNFGRYHGRLKCAVIWSKEYVRCFVNGIQFALIPASKITSMRGNTLKVTSYRDIVMDNIRICKYSESAAQKAFANEGREDSSEKDTGLSTIFRDDIQVSSLEGLPSLPKFVSGAASIAQMAETKYLVLSNSKMSVPLTNLHNDSFLVEIEFIANIISEKVPIVELSLKGARTDTVYGRNKQGFTSFNIRSGWTERHGGWRTTVRTRSTRGGLTGGNPNDKYYFDLENLTKVRIESRGLSLRVYVNDDLVTNSIENGFLRIPSLELETTCKGASILIKSITVKPILAVK